MSEKVIDIEEKISPMKLTDNETGNTYELDFCRESIVFAESRQFRLEDVISYPQSKVPELFYLAFRMHHKRVARSQTDAILNRMGGLTPAMVGRLSDLFQQAQYSHVLVTDEDSEKNVSVTVEL